MGSDFKISLNPHEMVVAGMVGLRRNTECIVRGYKEQFGATGDSWECHIEGAMGEMAFAKAMGLYWTGMMGFRATDVCGWEVKTRPKHNYDLIVRERDSDLLRLVLLTGARGSYMIRGWLYAGEGKKDQWWKNYGGREYAWFIPAEHLHPFEDMADHVGASWPTGVGIVRASAYDLASSWQAVAGEPE